MEVVAEIRAGAQISIVCRKFGVTRTSAYRWLRSQDLKSRKASGRPASIRFDKIRGLYLDGCQGQRWTAASLRMEIFQTFGVEYHEDHVSRLLKRLRKESV